MTPRRINITTVGPSSGFLNAIIIARMVVKGVRVDCVALKILDEACVQNSDAGFDGIVDHSVWK